MVSEREALLLALSIVAREAAFKHLSEAGHEVLEMMEYASTNAGKTSQADNARNTYFYVCLVPLQVRAG